MLAFACFAANPAFANAKATEIVTHAVNGFVRPGYQKFHQSASALTNTAQALCKTPSQAALDAARQSFGETVGAWSTIEIIRFGPVTEQNRLERVLFWPDRKGTGLKQVQAAIASREPTAADAAQLAGKSVAMQGLGALEFVLFGTDSEGLANTGEAYRCAYGAAIAGNLDSIAADLDAAWTAPGGFASVWANPDAANSLYRDGTEAVTELMDVFVTGFELVRDVRLGGFLGKTPDADKPRQALYWRSARTVDALAANLAGMKALFVASHLGDAVSADNAWVVQSALIQFDNAAADAIAANAPIADVLADPARRDRLEHLRLVTSTLSEAFGTRISGDLGLTAGFSSLDGD